MKPCKMRQIVTGKCLLEWLDPHPEFQSHTSETQSRVVSTYVNPFIGNIWPESEANFSPYNAEVKHTCNLISIDSYLNSVYK
jgi:hypothetical protein